MKCDVKVVTVEALQRATRGFGIRPSVRGGRECLERRDVGGKIAHGYITSLLWTFRYRDDLRSHHRLRITVVPFIE